MATCYLLGVLTRRMEKLVESLGIPDGWSGEWRIHETMRKTYVIVSTLPDTTTDGTSA